MVATLSMLVMFVASLAWGQYLDSTYAAGETDHLHGTLSSVLGKATVVSGAMLVFSIIDMVFLPWLKIRKTCFDSEFPLSIRVAIIRGWFTLAAAIVIAFAVGNAF